MNSLLLKVIKKLLGRFKADVQLAVEEKSKIIKEAQEKIDALKIEHIKKQVSKL